MPEEYVVEVKVENEESLANLTRAFNEVNVELNRLNASLARFQKTLNAQTNEVRESTKQSTHLGSVSQQVTKAIKNQASALTWLKRAFVGVAGAVAAVTVAYRHQERIKSILYKLDQRRHFLALSLTKNLVEYEKVHRTTARVLAAFGSIVSSLVKTTHNYVQGSYDANAAVKLFGKTVKTSITTVTSELRRAPADWLKVVRDSFTGSSKFIKDFLASTSKSTVETMNVLFAGVSTGAAMSLKMIANQVLPSVTLQFKNTALSARTHFAEVARSSSVLRATLSTLGLLAKNVGATFIDLGWGIKNSIEAGVISATTVFDLYDVSFKGATRLVKNFGVTIKNVAKTLAAPLAALITPITDFPSAISPSFREAVTRFKQFESSTWALARTTYEASRESASALRSFASASKVYLVTHLNVVKDVLGASAKRFKIWLSTLGVSEKRIPLLLKPFTLLLSSLAIMSGKLLKLTPAFRNFGGVVESAGWALNRASSFTRVYGAVVTNLDRGLTEITGTTKSVTRSFGDVTSATIKQKASVTGLLGGLGKLIAHYFLVYQWHLTIAHVIEGLAHVITRVGATWVASLHDAFEVSVEFLRTELDLIRASTRYQELTKDTTRTTKEWVEWADKLAVSLGKDIAPMRRVTGVLLDYAAVYGLTRSETERFIKLMIDVSTYLGTDVFMAMRHVRGALAGLSLSAMYLGIQVEALKERAKHYEEQLRKTGVAAGVDIKQKAMLLSLMDELNFVQGMTNKLMDTGYGAVHRYRVAQQALANAIGEAASPAMSSLYNIMTKSIGNVLELGSGFMKAYVGMKAFLGVAFQITGTVMTMAAKLLILMETLHMLEMVLTFVNKSLYALPIASVPFLRSIVRMEGETIKFKNLWVVAGSTISFVTRLAIREIKGLVVSGTTMLAHLATKVVSTAKAFATLRFPTFAVAALYGERFARTIATQSTVAARLTEALKAVGRANLETGTRMVACATSAAWLKNNIASCVTKLQSFGKASERIGKSILFTRLPMLVKDFKNLSVAIAATGANAVRWMSKAHTPITKHADTVAEAVRRTHGAKAATRAWGGALLQAIGLAKLSNTAFAGLLGRLRGLINFVINIGVGAIGALGEKFKLLWSIVRIAGVRFSLIVTIILGVIKAFGNLIKAISETFDVTIKLVPVLKVIGSALYDVIKPIIWLGKLAVKIVAGVLTEAFAGLALSIGLTLKVLEKIPWVGGKVKGLGDKFVELSFRLDEMAKGARKAAEKTRDLRKEVESLITTLETRAKERGLNLAVAESYKVLIERAIDYQYAIDTETKLRKELEELKEKGVKSAKSLQIQRERLQKVTMETNSAEAKFKKAIEDVSKVMKNEFNQVQNLSNAYIGFIRTHVGLGPALENQIKLHNLLKEIQIDETRAITGDSEAMNRLSSNLIELSNLFSTWAKTANSETKPALVSQAEHLKALAGHLTDVAKDLGKHPDLLKQVTDAYTKSSVGAAVFTSKTSAVKQSLELLKNAVEAVSIFPKVIAKIADAQDDAAAKAELNARAARLTSEITKAYSNALEGNFSALTNLSGSIDKNVSYLRNHAKELQIGKNVLNDLTTAQKGVNTVLKATAGELGRTSHFVVDFNSKLKASTDAFVSHRKSIESDLKAIRARIDASNALKLLTLAVSKATKEITGATYEQEVAVTAVNRRLAELAALGVKVPKAVQALIKLDFTKPTHAIELIRSALRSLIPVAKETSGMYRKLIIAFTQYLIQLIPTIESTKIAGVETWSSLQKAILKAEQSLELITKQQYAARVAVLEVNAAVKKWGSTLLTIPDVKPIIEGLTNGTITYSDALVRLSDIAKKNTDLANEQKKALAELINKVGQKINIDKQELDEMLKRASTNVQYLESLINLTKGFQSVTKWTETLILLQYELNEALAALRKLGIDVPKSVNTITGAYEVYASALQQVRSNILKMITSDRELSDEDKKRLSVMINNVNVLRTVWETAEKALVEELKLHQRVRFLQGSIDTEFFKLRRRQIEEQVRLNWGMSEKQIRNAHLWEVYEHEVSIRVAEARIEAYKNIVEAAHEGVASQFDALTLLKAGYESAIGRVRSFGEILKVTWAEIGRVTGNVLNTMADNVADAVAKWAAYGEGFKLNWRRIIADVLFEFNRMINRMIARSLAARLGRALTSLLGPVGVKFGLGVPAGAAAPLTALSTSATTAATSLNTLAMSANTAAGALTRTAVTPPTPTPAAPAPAPTAPAPAVEGAGMLSKITSGIKGAFSSIWGVVSGLFTRLSGMVTGLFSKVGTLLTSLVRFIPFQTGGKIRGTKNEDAVPALLTPGEWVINKKAVQKYGDAFLRAINEGLLPKPAIPIVNATTPRVRVLQSPMRFASGGPVPNVRYESAATPEVTVVTVFDESELDKYYGSTRYGRVITDRIGDKIVRRLSR